MDIHTDSCCLNIRLGSIANRGSRFICFHTIANTCTLFADICLCAHGYTVIAINCSTCTDSSSTLAIDVSTTNCGRALLRDGRILADCRRILATSTRPTNGRSMCTIGCCIVTDCRCLLSNSFSPITDSRCCLKRSISPADCGCSFCRCMCIDCRTRFARCSRAIANCHGLFLCRIRTVTNRYGIVCSGTTAYCCRV